MRRESRRQAGVCIRVYLTARLFRAENSVAERLSCLVGQLSSAERLDPRFSFVERIMRRPARAIQLFLQLVDKRHCGLVLEWHYSLKEYANAEPGVSIFRKIKQNEKPPYVGGFERRTESGVKPLRSSAEWGRR